MSTVAKDMEGKQGCSKKEQLEQITKGRKFSGKMTTLCVCTVEHVGNHKAGQGRTGSETVEAWVKK